MRILGEQSSPLNGVWTAVPVSGACFVPKVAGGKAEWLTAALAFHFVAIQFTGDPEIALLHAFGKRPQRSLPIHFTEEPTWLNRLPQASSIDRACR